VSKWCYEDYPVLLLSLLSSHVSRVVLYIRPLDVALKESLGSLKHLIESHVQVIWDESRSLIRLLDLQAVLSSDILHFALNVDMCTAARILPFRIRISSLLTSLQLPSAYFLLALHFNVPCQDLLVAIHVVLDLSIGFEGWPVLKDRWYSKLFNLLIRKYAIKCNDFVNFLQLSQSVSWGLLPVLDWLNLRLNGCLLFNTFHAL